MREVHNVVNGQVAAAQGPALDLINPSTGEVFGHAPVSGQADVDSAVAAAREAYLKWRDVTPSVRQKALLAMADLFEQNAEELVALESENTGKAIPVTMSEAWGNCDMNILMNGCETDLKTKDDCGVCDNVCNMGNCVWNGMDNWICMNS